MRLESRRVIETPYYRSGQCTVPVPSVRLGETVLTVDKYDEDGDQLVIQDHGMVEWLSPDCLGPSVDGLRAEAFVEAVQEDSSPLALHRAFQTEGIVPTGVLTLYARFLARVIKPPLRECIACGEHKGISHFGQRAAEIDGLHTVCKRCRATGRG